MKPLIIDRKVWRRGEDTRGTALLNSLGMCCLGFDALNEGMDPLDIHGIACPNLLNNVIVGITEFDGIELSHTKIAKNLMYANDNKMSERKRESKIKELFTEIGREVEFIN